MRWSFNAIPAVDAERRVESSVWQTGVVTLLAPLVIVVAGGLAYSNSLHGPFVFDDVASIVNNSTIRSLWPPGEALSPPGDWGLTVSGRPILNLSFAVNYAISGLEVWSYHLLNTLIHLAAGCVLYGWLRRLLARWSGAESVRGKADVLALVTALVWALHPVQTESVTYVVQRAESLMGLFVLLALYAFARGVESARPGRWWLLAVGSCWLGVGTKEVAVLIPVLALLYDRTFVAGSFREAVRLRRGVYLAMALSWIPLAWLVMGAGGNRGDTMGFGVGLSWFDYALTQFEAVSRYLWLSVWPASLIFDYGKPTVPSWSDAMGWAAPVLLLLAATIVGLLRRPAWGFLGAWFLALLAPTSLVPSIVQSTVEHRLYLPLIAVVLSGYVLASHRMGTKALVTTGLVLSLAAGAATSQRNEVYRSEEVLWRDTVTKRPANARAHNNLGRIVQLDGRFDEAALHYQRAVELDPANAQAHFNLGLVRFRLGQIAEGLPSFDEAVRLLPHFALAHLNRGLALRALGRTADVLPALQEASRHPPEMPEVHFHLAVELATQGQERGAVAAYARALALRPDYLEALSNQGMLLLRLGDVPQALVHLNQAVALAPASADLRFNLGLAEMAREQLQAAVGHYREAVRLDSTHAAARLNLGIALGQSGDLAGALTELTEAVRLHPESPEALGNLGTALLQVNRNAEALEAYEQALRFSPADPQAHYNVGYALLVSNRWLEARRRFEEALRLRPDFAPALMMLRNLDGSGGR